MFTASDQQPIGLGALYSLQHRFGYVVGVDIMGLCHHHGRGRWRRLFFAHDGNGYSEVVRQLVSVVPQV